jgi:hypothetical protein
MCTCYICMHIFICLCLRSEAHTPATGTRLRKSAGTEGRKPRRSSYVCALGSCPWVCLWQSMSEGGGGGVLCCGQTNQQQLKSSITHVTCVDAYTEVCVCVCMHSGPIAMPLQGHLRCLQSRHSVRIILSGSHCAGRWRTCRFAWDPSSGYL